MINSRRSKQMEKRERGVFQKSSTWWSLFQHCVHPKEHKIQMSFGPTAIQKQVKTSHSDPEQQHTQSHGAATGVEPRRACAFAFASLKSLSFHVSVSLHVFAELLECVCVFYLIYSCASQPVPVNLVQCDVVWVCPSFRSSSFCMSACRV